MALAFGYSPEDIDLLAAQGFTAEELEDLFTAVRSNPFPIGSGRKKESLVKAILFAFIAMIKVFRSCSA